MRIMLSMKNAEKKSFLITGAGAGSAVPLRRPRWRPDTLWSARCGVKTSELHLKLCTPRQAGDPAKAARVLLELVELEVSPTHLLLGSDALKLVEERLAALHDEIQAWESVSRSTDYM